MTSRIRSSSIPALLLLLLSAIPGIAEEAAPAESDFLSRVRQLTFEGRRAGEGYFSADGSKMVFQSEREPGNPFFQIYELDLETGDTRRISTGKGKTTCAYFRGATGQIVFASTHHDPKSEEFQRAEYEYRASGKKKRYNWDYDPEMDLYVFDPASKELRRLTEARGYDAEASYSPDGEWIVFASNRQVYDRDLSETDQRMLEMNPSLFAELYIIRADGSDLKRLTHTLGYDGGPFFSPDGKRIVWRRFDEEGLIADVWSMNSDGTDARQVTDFGCMSWAPYTHPSGEYILFTANKLGFQNFELFIVDSAGIKEPVRVTFTPGFDGLPVPSPDGTQLAWTSTRRSENHGQILLGEWNHARAVEVLRLAPSRTSPGSGAARP
jgi:Tol biopolymer transport system component